LLFSHFIVKRFCAFFVRRFTGLKAVDTIHFTQKLSASSASVVLARWRQPLLWQHKVILRSTGRSGLANGTVSASRRQLFLFARRRWS
jgi:hypothetical protein